MTVAVIPNLDKNSASQTVEKLGEFFAKNSIEAYLPDNICCSQYKHVSDDEIFKIADIIITIGGDGTIIRYAKRAAQYDKPLLGINAGRIGYLANLEQSEIKQLSKLITGDYTVENRMMLNIKVVENGKIIGEYQALNDAVVTSGFIARIIDVVTTVNGDSISYRADGIIVSTPTGSTAYSMSAGGPIIDPTSECICITPICSHSLSAKPILLNADKDLKLSAFSKKRTDIFLSVDGRKVSSIKPYTEIIISRSPKTVKLLKISDRSFFKTLSAKFLDIRSGTGER